MPQSTEQRERGRLLLPPLLLLLLLLCTSGLAKQQQKQHLLEALKEGGFNTLLEWLRLAGMEIQLGGDGPPLTLLAPTDAAFASLPPAIIWKMKASDDFLAKVIKYHIINGNNTLRDLALKGKISSLQGENLEFFVVKDLLSGSSSGVKVRQRATAATLLSAAAASNGLLYGLDRALLPPSLQEDPSLEEVLQAAGVTAFLQLAKEAGLVDVFLGGGPLTVFAPTNAALDAVDPSIMRQLRRQPRLMKAVVLSHLVFEDLDAHALRATSVTDNALGELVIFRKEGSSLFVNTAKVLREDLLARNGAAHIIDGLLLPSILALGSQATPPTTDLYSKMRLLGLTIFTSLVNSSGDASLFQSEEPMTVFAPCDRALASLPPQEVRLLLSDMTHLQSTVMRHVIKGMLPTSDFRPDLLRENFDKEKTRFNIYGKPDAGDVYTANGVPLTVPDESATNGVLHVVAAVLPSAAQDALQVLESDLRFSTFLSAVQASDLISYLRGDGPVTVFAATDEAFDALPDGQLSDGLFSLGKLTEILGSHIIPKNGTEQTLFSPGLCWNSFRTASGLTMQTAMGSDSHVLLSTGQGRVGKVMEQDMVASNGVVHVVDSLL